MDEIIYSNGGSENCRREPIKPKVKIHQELIEEIEDILEELKMSKYVAVKKFKRGQEMVENAPTRSLEIVYVKL